MAFQQQRVFMRSGVEEEEITPPCVKSRSFDSLSVAHILQAKLDPTVAPPSPLGDEAAAATAERSAPGSPPGGPGSPTIDAAAALLQSVHTSGGMDKAVASLMSLAGAAGEVESGAFLGGRHVPHSGAKRQLAHTEAGTRRRLKMRAGGSSGALHGDRGGGLRATVRAAPVAETHEGQNTLSVAGVQRPLNILSGASLQQLKLLSAAFKLCPRPSSAQIEAIARRVDVSADKLEAWFHSRRTLQEWVQQQPHLQAVDLARMFYPAAAGDENVPEDGAAATSAPVWGALS